MISGPHNVPIKVRMEGPYTADTTLQVVCYFKYSEAGAKKMSVPRSNWTNTLAALSTRYEPAANFVASRSKQFSSLPKAEQLRQNRCCLSELGVRINCRST